MSRQRPLRAAAPTLFLALASALSGCALVAGAGVGYVVSQQVLGDVNVAQVRDDVDDVWASFDHMPENRHSPSLHIAPMSILSTTQLLLLRI